MSIPKQNKDALGKGIRSLLQSIDSDLKNTSGEIKQSVVEAVTSVLRIPVELIDANPKQPRRNFEEQSLQELAQSIKLHDIIQPVTITKTGNRYRLISGERRWRAAKLAGVNRHTCLYTPG
jgi:ParB family chromosome partitioning protein